MKRWPTFSNWRFLLQINIEINTMSVKGMDTIWMRPLRERNGGNFYQADNSRNCLFKDGVMKVFKVLNENLAKYRTSEKSNSPELFMCQTRQPLKAQRLKLTWILNRCWDKINFHSWIKKGYKYKQIEWSVLLEKWGSIYEDMTC